MRAARILQEGSINNVEVVNDQKKPEAQPGEALICVQAAGLNNSDVAGIRGAFKAFSRVPRVLGRDFCGIVEEVNGIEQDAKWKNIPVWGTSGSRGLIQDGTFAEYVRVPIASLAKRPSNVPVRNAASLPLPWLCAYIAVKKLADLHHDDRVLVLGASGAIGSAICQMLRRHQVTCVYGTTRSKVQLLPPDVKTIQLKSDQPDYGLIEGIQVESGISLPKDSLDVVIDCTGQEALVNASLKLLSPRGKSRLIMMSTSTPSGLFSIDMRTSYLKSVTLKGLSSNILNEAQVSTALEEITEQFEEGSYDFKFCPLIEETALSAGTKSVQQVLEKKSSNRRQVFTL